MPPDDIHADLIPFTSAASVDLDALPPVLGPENFGIHTCDGEALSLLVGGRELPGVAFRPDDPELGGRITLDWPVFDWIEEEQPVIAHPHDPFGRIDVLSASRHVVVSLDGVTLADSRRPVGVFETHLPPRGYPPREDRADGPAHAERNDVGLRVQGSRLLLLVGERLTRRPRHRPAPTPIRSTRSPPSRIVWCFFAERTDLELYRERTEPARERRGRRPRSRRARASSTSGDRTRNLPRDLVARALSLDDQDLVMLLLQHHFLDSAADEIGNHPIDGTSVSLDHDARLAGGNEFRILPALA